MTRSSLIEAECPECGGDGLVEDPSACADDEHCSPWMTCPTCGGEKTILKKNPDHTMTPRALIRARRERSIMNDRDRVKWEPSDIRPGDLLTHPKSKTQWRVDHVGLSTPITVKMTSLDTGRTREDVVSSLTRYWRLSAEAAEEAARGAEADG